MDRRQALLCLSIPAIPIINVEPEDNKYKLQIEENSLEIEGKVKYVKHVYVTYMIMTERYSGFNDYKDILGPHNRNEDNQCKIWICEDDGVYIEIMYLVYDMFTSIKYKTGYTHNGITYRINNNDELEIKISI